MVNVSYKDGDYETRQDRALVETWAKASQEFRNVRLNYSFPLKKNSPR